MDQRSKTWTDENNHKPKKPTLKPRNYAQNILCWNSLKAAGFVTDAFAANRIIFPSPYGAKLVWSVSLTCLTPSCRRRGTGGDLIPRRWGKREIYWHEICMLVSPKEHDHLGYRFAACDTQPFFFFFFFFFLQVSSAKRHWRKQNSKNQIKSNQRSIWKQQPRFSVFICMFFTCRRNTSFLGHIYLLLRRLAPLNLENVGECKAQWVWVHQRIALYKSYLLLLLLLLATLISAHAVHASLHLHSKQANPNVSIPTTAN